MKCSIKPVNLAAALCLAALSGVAHADDTALNPAQPAAASLYANSLQSAKKQSFDSGSYLLAANADDATAAQANPTPAAEFKPPLLSGRKTHQYLGLGTLALFGLTALTAPGGERNNKNPPTTGIHQSLGRATAAMAVATVASGLLFHWDDFHFEDGLADPDNQHMMLAGAGALAMLYAVSTAPGHEHSSAGIAGGAAMLVAVKLTW